MLRNVTSIPRNWPLSPVTSSKFSKSKFKTESPNQIFSVLSSPRFYTGISKMGQLTSKREHRGLLPCVRTSADEEGPNSYSLQDFDASSRHRNGNPVIPPTIVISAVDSRCVIFPSSVFFHFSIQIFFFLFFKSKQAPFNKCKNWWMLTQNERMLLCLYSFYACIIRYNRSKERQKAVCEIQSVIMCLI